MHAVDVDPVREPLGVLDGVVLTEVVADRVDRGSQLLVVAARLDADRHGRGF
jgi:hypothetical protein